MNVTHHTRQLCLGGFLLLSMGLMLMSSCTNVPNSSGGNTAATEAEKFMTDVEKRLMELSIKSSRADWVRSTFITDDTESMAAEANDNLIAATTELAEQARRYENVDLSPASKRKLKLLKLSNPIEKQISVTGSSLCSKRNFARSTRQAERYSCGVIRKIALNPRKK